MNKNTAPQQGFLVIQFLIILIFLASVVGLYFYVQKTKTDLNPMMTGNFNKDTKLVVDKLAGKTIIDTSDWETFPTEGSYKGWTIKHPPENAPVQTQKDDRITLYNGDNEAMLITITRDSKFAEGSLNDHIDQYKQNEICKITTPVDIHSKLNGYDGYMFASDCSVDADPTMNSIMLKSKSTIIVVSPYADGDYVVIDTYTDKDFYNEDIDKLREKILDTLTILEPEAMLPDGMRGFYNSNLGFSIIYPEEYEAILDDYGWDNAELILYDGGQSYDLVVQIWDSEKEYKDNFGESPLMLDFVTVKKIGDKYVTLLNMNNTDEVAEIIDSFKLD